MEKIVKQYEQVVSHAWEISQALLDMEGGKYVLAMCIELVLVMLEGGNISGAVLVVRKLHEATEVSTEFVSLAESDIAGWAALFAEALEDALEGSVF